MAPSEGLLFANFISPSFEFAAATTTNVSLTASHPSVAWLFTRKVNL